MKSIAEIVLAVLSIVGVVHQNAVVKPVCAENLNPEVVVMKSAQDGK
jgi:hypothetical protein